MIGAQGQMASGRGSSDTAVLGPLFAQVYLPNLILATGQGAVIPILALAARQDGASTALAGVIVSMYALGTMVFDIPSGWVVAHLGEEHSTWVAVALLLAGVVGALLTHTALMLGGSVFIASCGWAIWSLVRLTHLSRTAPISVRGRALSIFGGVMRAGQVLGPFLVLGIFGKKPVRGSFLVYLVAIVIGFVWLTWRRDRTDMHARARTVAIANPLRIVAQNRHEFSTAGVGTLGISLLRGSRNVIIPLWGTHVGLSASQVDLIFGFSSLVDLSLFYPAGIVSDRFGRRAVAVPCLVLLSAGHFVMPLTHTFVTVLLAAMLVSFGNGLGSGIIMTMGADRAPDVGRAAFLSVWRFVSDAGTAGGPLVDSGLIALASLSLACPVMGVIGLLAAVVVGGWLEEPSGLAPAPVTSGGRAP